MSFSEDASLAYTTPGAFDPYIYMYEQQHVYFLVHLGRKFKVSVQVILVQCTNRFRVLQMACDSSLSKRILKLMLLVLTKTLLTLLSLLRGTSSILLPQSFLHQSHPCLLAASIYLVSRGFDLPRFSLPYYFLYCT
jgi:hypothetical protein